MPTDKNGVDPELKAMSDLVSVLDPLPEDARARALRWAAEKYGISLGRPRSARTGERERPAGDGPPQDFADLIDRLRQSWTRP
jgi:hypothetical protein